MDFFYFSLPAFGVNSPILKMTMSYEVIDGIYVPTVRESFAPNPETGKYQRNGRYGTAPFLHTRKSLALQ